MSAYPEYSLDVAIAEFFSQTSASREACDTKAKNLAGGEVVPVAVQGNCSYSVYAGSNFEFVVQFRLKSLMLDLEIVTLAREIYGYLAPSASLHGQLGEDASESLFIYIMDRIPGISYLDFILANSFPENSDENFVLRKTLISDVAQYGSPSAFSYIPNCTIKLSLNSLKKRANRVQFFCPVLESSSRGYFRSTRESTPNIYHGSAVVTPLFTTSLSPDHTKMSWFNGGNSLSANGPSPSRF
jgi:hypothetical protein